MASSVFFKEDPGQIANVAVLLQQECGKFKTNLSGMKSKAQSLKSNWKSDSSDGYQKFAKELDDDGQEHIKMLDEFVNKLQQASGIYTTAESTAANASQGLPTDGVFR